MLSNRNFKGVIISFMSQELPNILSLSYSFLWNVFFGENDILINCMVVTFKASILPLFPLALLSVEDTLHAFVPFLILATGTF